MMIIVKQDDMPEIPGSICCPICGDKLILEIDEWESDAGNWKASECGVHTRCASEPDVIDDNYDDWMNGHYRYPYIDWLPVEIAVYQWLEKNYRFAPSG
jgi:hypothetical protein